MPEKILQQQINATKIMIMEPNKFDQSIKEKMEARTIVPSAEAWEKLETMMPLVEKPKRKSCLVIYRSKFYWTAYCRYHFLSKF
jgi:hypothetical protein